MTSKPTPISQVLVGSGLVLTSRTMNTPAPLQIVALGKPEDWATSGLKNGPHGQHAFGMAGITTDDADKHQGRPGHE